MRIKHVICKNEGPVNEKWIPLEADFDLEYDSVERACRGYESIINNDDLELVSNIASI
jgi:hypothetical protein